MKFRGMSGGISEIIIRVILGFNNLLGKRQLYDQLRTD
ncbi:Uncharacterized protein dnm_042160 [Desulfonema magnum]|uniref:Uncharacterized protein n=1 Tax=Desulfonema magnum TaxID=45655 RepID=A0A975BMG6_9BACT|nr:Uncharacterized protein dnm_042160 [Desulfonema magnum]